MGKYGVEGVDWGMWLRLRLHVMMPPSREPLHPNHASLASTLLDNQY